MFDYTTVSFFNNPANHSLAVELEDDIVSRNFSHFCGVITGLFYAHAISSKELLDLSKYSLDAMLFSS